jgi:pilus assembly protein Flp/PilA
MTRASTGVELGVSGIVVEFNLKEHQVINFLKNLHKEESGQDLIEYALLALLIALAAVAILPTVGKSISNEFSKVAGQLT